MFKCSFPLKVDIQVLVVAVIAVVVLVVIGALARLGAFSYPSPAALPAPEPEPSSPAPLMLGGHIQWCQEQVVQPLIRRTGLEWCLERTVAASPGQKLKQLFLSCPSRSWSLVIVFDVQWRPLSWSCLGSREPTLALHGVYNQVDWWQPNEHQSQALMSLVHANAGGPEGAHASWVREVQDSPVGLCKLWCGAAQRATTLAWLAMESRRASLHQLISAWEGEVEAALLTFSRGPELSVLLARGESVGQELSWVLGGVERWCSALERMEQWRPLTEREQTLPLVMDCFEDRRHVELRWVAIWQIATDERLASLRPMLKGKIMKDDEEPWQALLFGALREDDSLYRRERYMAHYRRAWAQSRFDDGPDEVIIEIDRWWFGLLGESLVELLSWEQLWAGCLWRAKMIEYWDAKTLAKLYAGLTARISRQPRFEVGELTELTRLLRALEQLPLDQGQLLSCWLDRLELQADDDELWRAPHVLQAPRYKLPDDEQELSAMYQAHAVVLRAAAKRFGERVAKLWADGPDRELGHRLLEAMTHAAQGDALTTLLTVKAGVSRSARKRAEVAIKEIQSRLGRQHGDLTISSVSTGGELTQVTAAQGSVTVVEGRDE